MKNRRLLFCFAGLFCAVTLRAQTCETHLTSSGTQEAGLIFTSSVSLSGLSPHSAIGQIKRIVASDPAFEIGADSYRNNRGSLEITQKAAGKSREFPIDFTANDQGQVTFKATFPAGMGAKPADVASYACGKWLDQLQTGGRGNTLAAEGEKLSRAKTTAANEPSAVSDDDSAGSCQANFATQGFMMPGGYQYLSYIVVPVSSADSTLQQIKKAAQPRGYKVAEEKQVDDQEQVLLTAGSGGNPIVVAANIKNGHIGIGMQAPSGQPMFSQAARETLCGLLGQGTDNAAGHYEASSQSPHNDRGAAPDAASRTAAPETQLNVLRPSSIFDSAAAKAALEQGTSTIRGTACIRRAGNLILARSQHVYLYPTTPYLKDAMELMSKATPAKDRLDIDPNALATRLDGMTNREGQFQFARMKPGDYYLITTMQSAISGVQDINHGGSQTGPNEITFFHTLIPYTNHYGDILDKYVNVKNDGDSVDITLTSHIKWSSVFVVNSQSHAGLFGCRDGHGLW